MKVHRYMNDAGYVNGSSLFRDSQIKSYGFSLICCLTHCRIILNDVLDFNKIALKNVQHLSHYSYFVVGVKLQIRIYIYILQTNSPVAHPAAFCFISA